MRLRIEQQHADMTICTVTNADTGEELGTTYRLINGWWETGRGVESVYRDLLTAAQSLIPTSASDCVGCREGLLADEWPHTCEAGKVDVYLGPKLGTRRVSGTVVWDAVNGWTDGK